mmetsp:Transcript_24368/g.41387  ORF Transcript_24368/g.41387 Transcript_24368/m.41387 type:complete len:90 (+) Transcript_24368:1644-1913(+)
MLLRNVYANRTTFNYSQAVLAAPSQTSQPIKPGNCIICQRRVIQAGKLMSLPLPRPLPPPPEPDLNAGAFSSFGILAGMARPGPRSAVG